MSEPLYKHDCEKCRYLGTYFGMDVYACVGCVASTGSLIGREGDEPWAYSSSPSCVWERWLRDTESTMGDARCPNGSMNLREWMFSQYATPYTKATLLALAQVGFDALFNAAKEDDDGET